MKAQEIKYILKTLSEKRIQNTCFPNNNSQFARSNPPTYKLIEFDFNQMSLGAKLTFQKRQEYQTIVSYKQCNYERYPIYSSVKIKSTIVNKSIKLTNLELENLKNNSDFLIRAFCYEIISRMPDESFFPSWAIKDCYLDKNEREELNLKTKIERATSEFLEVKSAYLRNINSLKQDNNSYNDKILETEKKIFNLSETIRRISENKTNLFKSLFTLFVYNLINSKKRLVRLQKKLQKNIAVRDGYKRSIENNQQNISESLNFIDKHEKEKDDKIKKIEMERIKISTFCADEISKIKKLPTTQEDYLTDSEFMPITDTLRFDKEKINGVYVIKNNELNKYYVGQSKNILYRLRQHFKGYEPKNIIFAKDYFSSSMEKQKLWSVKIIPLETKDELDSKEKELIDFYDSFNNGYNQTGGNT